MAGREALRDELREAATRGWHAADRLHGAEDGDRDSNSTSSLDGDSSLPLHKRSHRTSSSSSAALVPLDADDASPHHHLNGRHAADVYVAADADASADALSKPPALASSPSPTTSITSDTVDATGRVHVRTTSIVYCMALYSTFLFLGLTNGILGPSLLEIGAQASASLRAMSYVFTMRSFGLFLGTLLGGRIVDRYSQWGHIQLFAACAVQTLLTFVIPFQHTVGTLLFFGVIQGMAMGVIDNVAQMLLIRHYKELVAPYMQGIHCAFGVGSFLAPLVLSPFLSSAVQGDLNNLSDEDLAKARANTDDSWHYAWVLLGIAGIPICGWVAYYAWRDEIVPYARAVAARNAAMHAARQIELAEVASALSEGQGDGVEGDVAANGDAVTSSNATTSSTSPTPPPPALIAPNGMTQRTFTIHVVLYVGVFLMFYVGCESGYGSYIYTYAVTHAQMSDSTAALLNSCFWGAFSLGRFAGIFVSLYWSSQRMVFTDLAGCIFSVILVLAFYSSQTALWIGTILYGFSVGSIYASAVNYTEYLVSVSGSLLSYLVVFAALGDAAVPLLIGTMFTTSAGPIGMMVVVVVVATLSSLVFVYLVVRVAPLRQYFVVEPAGAGANDDAGKLGGEPESVTSASLMSAEIDDESRLDA